MVGVTVAVPYGCSRNIVMSQTTANFVATFVIPHVHSVDGCIFFSSSALVGVHSMFALRGVVASHAVADFVRASSP